MGAAAIAAGMCGPHLAWWGRGRLGAEIDAPLAEGNSLADCFLPKKSRASGLNRLHCPDAVLFQGMSPIVALSGHTEGYLRTLTAQNLQQQFPAFRMPIVAAFDRKQCHNIEG